MSSPVKVALALVVKGGRLLITQRPPGTHLGGMWEFPGGKLRDGELPERCAEREVLEETGVRCRAESCRPAFGFRYPEREVWLIPVKCAWLEGEPELLEVADARWVTAEELSNFEFPEANGELIRELSKGF